MFCLDTRATARSTTYLGWLAFNVTFQLGLVGFRYGLYPGQLSSKHFSGCVA